MNTELKEAQFARCIRSILDESVADLDQKTSRRLYDIRLAALDHQAQPVVALSLAGITHGIGHFLADSVHSHYRGILAFLALTVGAAGVQLWHNAQQAAELAEIDSALLSDEVPPGAYTDQGFLEWLDRLSSQQQENS